MEPFIHHTGLAIPLDRTNVNTDDIIPARFLKTIKRSGFEHALFANWRYLANDSQPDTTFVLNQPRYQGGSILLTKENFGCGSSREHAPWALHDYGIKSIIAPSFADIFYNNCLNNGILPIVLPAKTVNILLNEADKQEGYMISIDLRRRVIRVPGTQSFHFVIDSFRQQALLQGLDSIGWTLSHTEDIENYERRRSQEAPWLFSSTTAVPSSEGLSV